MKNKTIIIATGGTGGHIFPAQAISDKLVKMGFHPILICDDRANPFLQGSFLNIPRYQLNISSFSGNLLSKLQSLNKLLFSTYKVIFYYLKVKPKCVIGFGGYPSFPSLAAAILLFIPIVIYEPNSVLGRVNRWFLPFAKKLAVFMHNTHGIKTQYQHKTEVIGNIVRDKLLEAANISKKTSKKFTILVIGGSQGAQIFSQIIPDAIQLIPDELKAKLQIIQQVRLHLLDHTLSRYQDMKVQALIKPFFDNMAELYQKTDIVICRSGASTISELMLFKMPALLIPYPHATDNHQYYNALELTENGAALMMAQDNFNPQKLAELLITFIQDKSSLLKFHTAYSSTDRQNGVDRLVKIILSERV